MKTWNSGFNVLSFKDHYWLKLQCLFTPEVQMRHATKFLFVNNWNSNSWKSKMYVTDNGDIVLQRDFRARKELKWGNLYDQISDEIALFLDTIDEFQKKLREEEDAAKVEV